MANKAYQRQVVILIGAPAAGKGTVAHLLEAMGYTTISTGTMLRQEVAEGTELGKTIDTAMRGGGLVPDDIIIEMVRHRISEMPESSLTFDGFPRAAGEAKALDDALREYGFDMDKIHVFRLNVSNELLHQRFHKRRDDHMKAGMALRKDDDPAVFERRLAAYGLYSVEVASYYGNRVHNVDASHAPHETLRQIELVIGRHSIQETRRPKGCGFDVTAT